MWAGDRVWRLSSCFRREVTSLVLVLCDAGGEGAMGAWGV